MPRTHDDLPGLRAWPRGRWRQHRPWLLPLLMLPVCYLAAEGLLRGAARRTDDGLAVLLSLGGLLVLCALPVVAVLTLVKGTGMWRAYRRSRGKYTRSERDLVARLEESGDHWRAARRLASSLASGQAGDGLQVWGLVLAPDERVLADVPATYARYYGTDASYTHVSGLYFGRLSLVAAASAATALGNSRRRRQAALAATDQWREVQPVRVVVTSERLICLVGGSRWLSFSYRGATAIYPEPHHWSLVMDFPDTPPLRITGDGAPASCVAAVWSVHGRHGLMDHPGLQELRR